MNHLIAVMLAGSLAGLVLAGCQTTTAAAPAPAAADAKAAPATSKRLATMADLQAIIGKTLTLEPGKSFTINADGTFGGTWGDGRLAGTYVMRDGFWCRTITEGPSVPPDCQLLVLEGNRLHGTRDKGKGVSFTYLIS